MQSRESEWTHDWGWGTLVHTSSCHHLAHLDPHEDLLLLIEHLERHWEDKHESKTGAIPEKLACEVFDDHDK